MNMLNKISIAISHFMVFGRLTIQAKEEDLWFKPVFYGGQRFGCLP
ncbi:hypothetical protein PAPH110629_04475 [Paenibacillus phoenicis]